MGSSGEMVVCIWTPCTKYAILQLYDDIALLNSRIAIFARIRVLWQDVVGTMAN
jgi:hypothetical protein